MKPKYNGKQTKYHKKGECLLRHVDFVSDSEPTSFGQGQIAWEVTQGRKIWFGFITPNGKSIGLDTKRQFSRRCM